MGQRYQREPIGQPLWVTVLICAMVACLAPLGVSTVAAEPEPSSLGKTLTLENGLHATVIRDGELPLVTLRLGLPVGRLHDPRGSEGMAELLARTLSDVRAGQVEALGGEAGAYVTNDYTVFWVRGLAADSQRLLALLVQTVAEPRVSKADLGRARDRLRGELKLDQSRPGPVARRRLMEAIYGPDQPLGRNTGWRSLGRTGRKEAEERLARYYGAGGAELVVVGRIDSDRFLAAVKETAGRWGPGEILPPEPAPEALLDGPRVVRISMKGLTQSSIILGWPGIRRPDPEWERFQVFNHVLGGGGFSSRLMQAVRVEQGRTYGISSSAAAGLTAGPITIATATAGTGTDTAVSLILHELERLLRDGITRQELTEAREHLKGSYQLSQATPDGLAGMMISARMLGLGASFVDDHLKRLEAVDAAAALETGRRLLHAGDYVLVVVENRN